MSPTNLHANDALGDAVSDALSGTYAPKTSDWMSGADYVVGQMVVSAGTLYRCTTAHTAGGSFAAGNFTTIGGGASPVAPRRSVLAGDIVRVIGGIVSGAVTPNIGQEQCLPFVVPPGLKFSELRVQVSTAVAGGLLRLGVRLDANGYPDQLVSDLGTIDASSTGIKALTGLSITSPEPDGLVWIVSCAQGSAGAAYLQYTGNNVVAAVSDVGQEPINLSGWPSRGGITGALPGAYAARGAMSYQSPPAVYAIAATA